MSSISTIRCSGSITGRMFCGLRSTGQYVVIHEPGRLLYIYQRVVFERALHGQVILRLLR